MDSLRFYIRGDSMNPHFNNGDEIEIVECDEINTGDMIVFEAGKYGTLIKKVTGVPGDEIPQTGHLRNWSDIYGKLSQDWFIVEGTGLNSVDSRIFGPIHRSYILGKAVKING